MQSIATIALLGLAALTSSPPVTLHPVTQEKAPQSLIPEAKNLDPWADFIRPSRDELLYESIGWRNQFWPAVQEAKELGRPILLWTMNGHPLGCT